MQHNFNLAYTIPARGWQAPGDVFVFPAVDASRLPTMAVLPASYKVNFRVLRDAIGADRVELATEKEFRDMFPGCELGAMPPCGILGTFCWPARAARNNARCANVSLASGRNTPPERLLHSIW